MEQLREQLRGPATVSTADAVVIFVLLVVIATVAAMQAGIITAPP
jgi:hypothetical protein